MKLKKSQRSNLIFFGIIAILFLTPIRGYIQEFTAKLFSFAPSIENVENRVVVSNYNWNLKGLNTSDYTFKEAKGKVVFVNYWATWCPPCRAERSDIQLLYNDYKDQITFIFITNEESKKVNEFLTKNKYTLPTFNPLSRGPSEFQVSSIPATYILNKKGEIVIHKVGPADWDGDTVRKLLDKLIIE